VKIKEEVFCETNGYRHIYTDSVMVKFGCENVAEAIGVRQ
jgi:hypothetical protein